MCYRLPEKDFGKARGRKAYGNTSRTDNIAQIILRKSILLGSEGRVTNICIDFQKLDFTRLWMSFPFDGYFFYVAMRGSQE